MLLVNECGLEFGTNSMVSIISSTTVLIDSIEPMKITKETPSIIVNYNQDVDTKIDSSALVSNNNTEIMISLYSSSEAPIKSIAVSNSDLSIKTVDYHIKQKQITTENDYSIKATINNTKEENSLTTVDVNGIKISFIKHEY